VREVKISRWESEWLSRMVRKPTRWEKKENKLMNIGSLKEAAHM
jgi:hypothetical protein